MSYNWLQKAVENTLCVYLSKQKSSYLDHIIYTEIGPATGHLSIEVLWWYYQSKADTHSRVQGSHHYTTQEALRIFLAS